MSEIVFHKTAEEESNAASCQKKNAIIELELYLISLEHGQNGVFLKDFLQLSHSNWPDTSLGIRQKNLRVFDRRKFVTSFFDMWFDTLLTAKRYKKQKKMLETALKEGLSFGIIWPGLFIDTIKPYT